MNNCDASDSPYNVLLIEDDLVDVELVTRYLGQSRNPRFVVESAQYFQQAVELLAVGTFDAVLLDLNLPDSCGLDSIDLVMSAWGSGPIIILTGVEEDCLGIDAMRHGAQDYLVKEGALGESSHPFNSLRSRAALFNQLPRLDEKGERATPARILRRASLPPCPKC